MIKIFNKFSNILLLEIKTLCKANLCEADLREADLCEADLRGADLCKANLRGANLYRADLREAVNIIKIPISDLDYDWYAIKFEKSWMIKAGCRWFTINEARNHWISDNYKRSETVKSTVQFALDWVEVQ